MPVQTNVTGAAVDVPANAMGPIIQHVQAQYIYQDSKLLASADYFAELIYWQFRKSKMDRALEF